MKMQNAKIILIKNYSRPFDKVKFEREIEKEYKTAERDEFIKPDEFFECCFKALKWFEDKIELSNDGFIDLYYDIHINACFRWGANQVCNNRQL